MPFWLQGRDGVFVKRNIFSVENGVGKIYKPVAQVYYPAVVFKLQVEWDMPVTVNEKVEVLFFENMFGMQDEMLFVFAKEFNEISFGKAAVF